MLVGGVIDDQLGDDLQPAAMRLVDEVAKVIERAVVGVHVAVVGDVVAVVAQGRRIERQQPDRVDAQLLNVIEPLRESGKIADAVARRIVKRLDVHLIDDGVLVPERISRRIAAGGLQPRKRRARRAHRRSAARVPSVGCEIGSSVMMKVALESCCNARHARQGSPARLSAHIRTSRERLVGAPPADAWRG